MTKLRPVLENELEMVMHWRMMPEITKYMYTDPILTLAKQKEWYLKQQQDANNLTFMIEVDNVPCGILNIIDIDPFHKRCHWGYYMAVKEKRSLKLAMALEWNLYDYVFDTLQLNKLCGEIFSFNKEVIRIHQMCGSQVEGVLRQHIYKNNSFHDVTLTSILKEDWYSLRDKYQYEKIPFITQ